MPARTPRSPRRTKKKATRRGGEPAISDAAVKAATGKTWAQWLTALDRWRAPGTPGSTGNSARARVSGAVAGARSHAEIARHLAARYGLSPWWSQAVTVRYEQERGLRQHGQRSTGDFRVTVQRTVDAPLARAWAAWTDAAIISRWFTTRHTVDLRVGGEYRNADGDRGVILLIEPRKRLRFTWDNPDHCPGTLVEVTFSSRADARTTVRLEHLKIADRKGFDDMKTGWSWAMDSLTAFLETGTPIRHADWLAARG
jgi:uncharacterized protein YndB with AHSA1/START domain